MPEAIDTRTTDDLTAASGGAPFTPIVGFGDFQWPPPKDWQKLERICHLLWRKIWKDPTAQMNGRPGQQQHGVDVFGIPEDKTRVHGIQCKRKDVLLETLLTEKEVRTEVENAKGFRPPLEKLIIATCAPNDAKLQALALQITEEHAAQGLFRVDILGWTEIAERMMEHPEVIAQVYGLQRIPERARDIGATARAEAQHAEIITGQLNIQDQLARLSTQLAAPAEGPAHAKLDVSRGLLQAHEYRPALQVLEELHEQEWKTANASVRFRIATNLGAAYVGLGEYAKAGEWYLQAFAFDSTSDKALANRALGLLLLERPSDALAAAREALHKHPTSPFSWKAYLNVLTRVEPQAPLPEVPAALAEDSDVLFLRADALAVQRQWSEAEGIFRKLIALPEFDVLAKSRLAEVILMETTGGRFYGGVPYASSELARLTEALALLDGTWNELKDTDRSAPALQALQNACALRAVLGRIREAETAIDEGLVLAPDVPALLVWKIRLAATRGDGAMALRFLDKLAPDAVEEYPVIAASAYRAAKDFARAADLLERYIRSTSDAPVLSDPELANDARCMFADLVCQSDLAHAEARFTALTEAGTAPSARPTVIFARALRGEGEVEAAERYLALAREPLSISLQVRDRLMLADALAEFGEYESAVAIYEKDVATGSDTPSLREYIRCLFELDRRRQLTVLLAGLPDELFRKAHYEWLRANLSLRSGDYLGARAALERCLTIEPSNFTTRLLWTELCIRLRNPRPAQDWLATIDIRSTTISLDELLRIGRIRHALGQTDEAAATFYEGLRRFPHDPRSHLAFCSSVLFKGSPAWLPNIRTVAERDTAVRLRNADGREDTYVLEDRPPAELQSDEIAVGSDFGARLLGRKVGETVTGHVSDLAVHESTVTAVEHKYAHALHASLAAFNTRFPEHPGLVGVKMPLSGSAEAQLGPMLRALKEKSAYVNQIEALLGQGMPIAGLGTMMGRTSIEAWRGLSGRAAKRIPVCVGSPEERQAAIDLLKRHPTGRYILEPIALMELHLVDALDAVEATVGRLGVVQATLEELRGLISELDLRREGYMTMFEHGGQYYRHTVTAKIVATERQSLQSLLDWVRAHCDVISAVPAADPGTEISAGLDRALGHTVYDTLLAAQGWNRVLLSDDFNLRRLAKSELGVEGIWIQPLLMYAADTKRLNQGHYNRAVIHLATWRHDFTSINAQHLLFTANRHGWKVTPEFEALASTLPLSRAELRSHLWVCFWFLKELWKKGRGPTRSQATKLTHALLKGVDPAKSPNSEIYFRELGSAARRGLLPGAAWQSVVEWYQSQKLPPLYF